MSAENTLGSKVKRTITSVLPITKTRRGHCANCGQCCKLPRKCPFLKTANNKSYCAIYKVRPLNCRKYPRVAKECLTTESCGFYFEA